MFADTLMVPAAPMESIGSVSASSPDRTEKASSWVRSMISLI